MKKTLRGHFMKKALQKQIIIEHYIRSEEAQNMLTLAEAMIINILASFMGKKEKCWPQQKKLAKACYMSERTLRTSLRKLESKGIIRIDRKKHKLVYSFDPFWFEECKNYCTPSHAANAAARSANAAARSANAAGATIYNNNNNNKKNNNAQPVDNFYQKAYEPAESGQQAEWYLELQKKH